MAKDGEVFTQSSDRDGEGYLEDIIPGPRYVGIEDPEAEKDGPMDVERLGLGLGEEWDFTKDDIDQQLFIVHTVDDGGSDREEEDDFYDEEHWNMARVSCRFLWRVWHKMIKCTTLAGVDEKRWTDSMRGLRVAKVVEAALSLAASPQGQVWRSEVRLRTTMASRGPRGERQWE